MDFSYKKLSLGNKHIYSLFNVDQLQMLVQLPTEHILVKNKNALTYRPQKAQIQTMFFIIVLIRPFFVDIYEHFYFLLGYALLAVEPRYVTDRH